MIQCWFGGKDWANGSDERTFCFHSINVERGFPEREEGLGGVSCLASALYLPLGLPCGLHLGIGRGSRNSMWQKEVRNNYLGM